VGFFQCRKIRPLGKMTIEHYNYILRGITKLSHDVYKSQPLLQYLLGHLFSISGMLHCTKPWSQQNIPTWVNICTTFIMTLCSYILFVLDYIQNSYTVSVVPSLRTSYTRTCRCCVSQSQVFSLQELAVCGLWEGV